MSQTGGLRRLVPISLLALANLAFAFIPEPATPAAVVLDYACVEYAVRKCRCSDEYALNECQLSGGAQACHDLYPLVCTNAVE